MVKFAKYFVDDDENSFNFTSLIAEENLDTDGLKNLKDFLTRISSIS